jgi:hypothetical protein
MIIDKEAIPDILFGVVGDGVFAPMIGGVASPSLDHLALIQRKMDIASAAAIID